MSKRLSERLRAMLYEDIALEVEAMENELASARKLLATRVESARLSEANTKLAEADALIAKGLAVVHDFLPNIGRCVLQDYQRMNEFCSESAARAADPTDGARFTHKVTCPATSEDCYMGGVCTCGATDQQDVTP